MYFIKKKKKSHLPNDRERKIRRSRRANSIDLVGFFFFFSKRDSVIFTRIISYYVYGFFFSLVHPNIAYLHISETVDNSYARTDILLPKFSTGRIQVDRKSPGDFVYVWFFSFYCIIIFWFSFTTATAVIITIIIIPRVDLRGAPPLPVCIRPRTK